MSRTARCTYFRTCGSEVASKPSLAFFEPRDDGSAWASVGCGTCRYHEVAHEKKIADPGARHLRDVCDNFTPRGGSEHDEFYCGCKGWD